MRIWLRSQGTYEIKPQIKPISPGRPLCPGVLEGTRKAGLLNPRPVEASSSIWSNPRVRDCEGIPRRGNRQTIGPGGLREDGGFPNQQLQLQIFAGREDRPPIPQFQGLRLLGGYRH